MSFSFIFTAGKEIEPFEINRSLDGLWDSLGIYRTNPTEQELYSRRGPFDGWKLPWWRIYEMYAGVVAINALKPLNHPIYPRIGDNEGDFIEGYWRLFESSDMEDKESRAFVSAKQVKEDYSLGAKVQYLYKHHILIGTEGRAEDWEGHLSVYFWDFLGQFQKWLHFVIQLHEEGKVEEVKFVGG